MLAEAAAVFVSAVLVWSRKLWPLQVLALAVTYGAAIMFGLVRPAGCAALAAILLLAWLCSAMPDGLKGVAVHGVFFVVAVPLSLRLLPGFQNPLLLGPVRFTPDAVPFKMYLNLDKASVGFALMLFYSPLVREMGIARTLLAAAAGVILGLLLTLPPALLLGAIRWEPKYPEALQLWALDNFLLVALAEEALFRGFLQASLSRWLNGVAGSTAIAISVSALSFGALHYGSGSIMILLATLAGLAYGLAFQYGGLLASMLAHFGLNLCHILLFTYPLLASR
jgi:membrane protease YdiL (CAAX protease family)